MEFFITAKSFFVILHALSAAIGLGAVVITDSLFFKFLKDFRVSKKESETLNVISKVIWGAIGALFLTGLALYFSAPAEYLAKSKFITKLILFLIIVFNGFLLHIFISPYLQKISFNSDAENLRKNIKIRILRRIAFASGAVSLISWLCVFLLGSVRSIPLSTQQALGVYIGLVCIGVLGSQVFAQILKKKKEHSS